MTGASSAAAAPVRLIRLGAVGPARSQAVYHAVAEEMGPGTPDTVILTRPDAPYLCLGYHQTFDAVLERAECRRRGLPVLRRRVGGGATYLDGNQLFYQFVFHHARVPANFARCYRYLLAAPVAALGRLGLDGRLNDINEVEVGARRIAGIGGGRIGDACVVVGNFLFDFDFQAMARVWRVPSPGFRKLAARALPECVVTLRELLGSVGRETVQELLEAELAPNLERPVEAGELTPAEWERAAEVEQRLGEPAFLNLHGAAGARPMRSLKISSRGHIHAVELGGENEPVPGSVYVRDGVIVAVEMEETETGQGRGGAAESGLLGKVFSDVRQIVAA